MKQIEKYTVKEICEMMGAVLPPEYSHIAGDKLPCVANGTNGLVKGCGFILSGLSDEERERKLYMALDKKAKIIFAKTNCRSLSRIDEIPHAYIKDFFEARVNLAQALREKSGVKVVGITGSIGKTSTKELIHTVLSQQYHTSKSPANYNDIRGIFASVQKIDTEDQYHVQEFCVPYNGITMEGKARACMPDAAVVTNIGDAHIEAFGSRKNILKEKIKLASVTAPGSPAFLNYDDELLREVELENQKIISFAVHNKNADYYAEDIQIFNSYMTFTIVHHGRRTPITMNVVGIHNVGNAAVAMAVGEWAGIPLEKIVAGIAAFRTTGIRQTQTNIGGYNLFIDCFNASPVSMIGAVRTLEMMPVSEGGKRIAVLGEMLELGDHGKQMHVDVGHEVGKSNLDLVLCFGGENAKVLAETIRKYDKAVVYVKNRERLNSLVSQLITKKDLVMFKGSHATLLHKTIDQVFGTSFHLSDHRHVETRGKRFRYKIAHDNYSETNLSSIFQYMGNEVDVVLPKTYEGAKSFCVGAECFKNSKIHSVDIVKGIGNISSSAFAGCKELEKVNFPETLKLIETKAFAGCAELKEIVIPEGVIEIAEEAFANCTALKRVVLPESLGRIGEGAFAGCGNVKFECVPGSYAEKYVSELK